IMQSEPFTPDGKRKVDVPRPGHADFVGGVKYAHEDMRNVLERASARETAMRVALSVVPRVFLAALGVHIGSRMVSIGDAVDSTPLPANLLDLNDLADASPVRCLGKKAETQMVDAIEAAKKAGDTLGGVFEVVASGLMRGIGSYTQWDHRLGGRL